MAEVKHENLNVRKVSLSIETTLDSLGNVEMGGIKLNQPTVELLDLNSLSLDVHVAMHPAAIAYYGALKKEASRELTTQKRAYDRWYKKMWSEAKVKCGGDYKPTREDVESRLVVDNHKSIEEWDNKIDEAQKYLDTLESWFEAWRQKSFALRDHVSIDEEERFSSNSSMGRTDVQDAALSREEVNSEKIRRVRNMIRKRRETQGGSAV